MPDTNITPEALDAITKEVKGFGGDIKALTETTQRDLKEMRGLIDGLGKAVDPVAKERIDKFATAVETMQNAIETGGKELTARLDKVEATLQRPGASAEFADGEQGKAAKAAFDFHRTQRARAGNLKITDKVAVTDADHTAYAQYCEAFPIYMRRGDQHMPRDYNAMLQTGVDPDGGYLVPTEVSQRIVTKVYETSPLRQFANVETIAGKDMEIPRDEGEFGYGWVGETEDRSETSTGQLGVSKIVAHEIFAQPKATLSMLEDAGFDVENWMGRKVGDRFARGETNAFFVGNGVNKPKGLLTYPAGTNAGQVERIASGHATLVTADALWDLVYSLKDFYAANARFMMKRTTVRDIMKLKDLEGQYLWQPGLKEGQPSMLCGHPLSRAEDMPVVAAAALPIAFGDFREAYTIVDRLGIQLIRDNITEKGKVKFYNRKRVGGDVVNFEALKLMVVSAS